MRMIDGETPDSMAGGSEAESNRVVARGLKPPRGRRVIGDQRRVPLPLASASITVCPVDDACPMTVEIIFIACDADDDQYTAGDADIPKLAEAGWREHELGPLRAWIRVVTDL